MCSTLEQRYLRLVRSPLDLTYLVPSSTLRGFESFNLRVESHDDLVDGPTELLQGLAEQGLAFPKTYWIET
jgi:hypothetical protein